MLDLLLLVVFAFSLLIGMKRGFIMQAINLIGFFIALIVAYVYYKPLADRLVLWVPYPGMQPDSSFALVLDALDVDKTFYRIIAFAVIFFVVKIALKIVASIFDFLAFLPILKSFNRLLGAMLCFVEYYFVIFILLYVFALIPVDAIQKYVAGSIIANFMLEHTPIVTQMFRKLWYIYLENQ